MVPPPPRPGKPPRQRLSAAWKLLIGVLSTALLLGLVGVGLVAAYAAIAAGLPEAEELSSRSAGFLSTQILDRDGHLLYEITDPHGGRRIIVRYEDIAPDLINATVATEDGRFWQHAGVDPINIARAVIQNIREMGIASGASTIPQQLVKLVLLSPEERTEQTLSRKIREAVLATEVSRRYGKQEILATYLNEINYGNLAYGIEAASETYFGKTAGELTLAEASFLAGLPQAPAYWDPYSNWEGAKRRQAVVLGLMAEEGYITIAEAGAAQAEELLLRPYQLDIRAPHFVIWVQQLLEESFGTEVLYRSGLRVYTTLDSGWQAIAEQEIQAHLATLQDQNAKNGALVAMRPDTGEILVMVGSADFNSIDIAGQINMAMRPRQPGSSIKPITYVAAFEKGWTPATLVWDVTTEFRDGAGNPYVPRNYDGKEHGPVLVRNALAQSLNIPAVKALEYVGLPSMLETARRMGITSLTRADYGLSLTLGGGEVSLVEMVGAYAVLDNGGVRVPPVAIRRIEDAKGNLLREYQAPQGEEVVNAQLAYLVTDILSDNEARAPVFGRNNPLLLSRPAAAKTGTTNDYRDAWTVGYTPELVVGVWVGNADNTEMAQVAGSRGASPIWHNFMEKALAGLPARQFARPTGIQQIEISADSGALPSSACPPDRRRTEIFAEGQQPLGAEHDFHRLVRIDTSTGLLAGDHCPAGAVQEHYFLVLPGVEGQQWAAGHGIPQPPQATCSVHGAAAQVAIYQPQAGSVAVEEVYVVGQANMPDFSHYIVEYGEGRDPIGWGAVAGPVHTPVDGGILALWDVRYLQDRDYTLRVVAFDSWGNSVEARTWVLVQNPTPTPMPTDTPVPTETPWPTDTPVPTETPWPTDVPWPTQTPEPTPTATTEPSSTRP
ncbi:MAG TPA: PBP1A family penicillin-binding protein [Anaerolineae bacterium]|nr:PBP1A family penicillin-binding protein [Anaerolineae bacterium]